MSWTIHLGDSRNVLKELPAEHFHCCVTSPPYFGLRDYGHDGQIGLEQTPEAFVQELVSVFREVRRVLRDDGTLWLNLGDSYVNHPSSAVNRNGMTGSLNNGASEFECRVGTRGSQQRKVIPEGMKPKDLMGIPWRVAFALQADGWYLRQDIIWHKPNPMPESVRDRCTKAHEYIFLLSKSPRYYFNSQAIKEPAVCSPSSLDRVVNEAKRKALRTDIESRHRSAVTGGQTLQANPDGTRNRRSVWSVATRPFKGAHFATFPPDLIEPCILAGSPPGGHVLDPFSGAGTTGMVCIQQGRSYTGIELNPEYLALSQERLKAEQPPLPFSQEVA